MKVCFPVQSNKGIDSMVYNHFGSAPFFVIVDLNSNEVIEIINNDQHHEHGACNPIKALQGQVVDAIVVAGIGAGALIRLNMSGIKVYKANALTVQNNIEMIKTQSLSELTIQHCCGGHGHGESCNH